LNLDQAVILAGGIGQRLRPITNNIPKPMAPINGIPFMDYLIHSIIQAGIKNFLILLGYKADLIITRYKNMKNINIEFSHGTEKDLTGRRVLNAYNHLDDHFLLVYGDNYWPIELDSMCSNYKKLGAALSTTVFANNNGTGEYGFENNVVVGNDNIVVRYDKKREISEANGVDIGYFILAKDVLDPQMIGNVSFEVDILPQFIARKQLGAYITDTQYYYITNMQTLKDFENAALTNNFLPLPQKYFGV
jgi:D-glycero-D-manno-heptose 1,7-bisphosphate phosphatase